MQKIFSDNPNYVRYETLLKRLHVLLAEGKNDSEEVEQVHEEMDEPEGELSGREIKRLNGLSADLYMLQDDEMYEGRGLTELTPEQFNAQVKAAWENKDWDAMLRLLRKGPGLFSKDQVAFLRAGAYGELGHLDTSTLFLKYAIHKNPNVYDYRYMLVARLVDIGQMDEAIAQANCHLADKNSPPDLQMQAALVLSSSIRGMKKQEARPVIERAVRVLRSALNAAVDPATSLEDIVVGWVTLGDCFIGLSQLDNALDAYRKSWETWPGNPMVRDAINALLNKYPSTAPMVHQALRKLMTEEEATVSERMVINQPDRKTAVRPVFHEYAFPSQIYQAAA